MAMVISPTCTSARAPRARGFRSAAALSSARITAVSMDLSTATTAPAMLEPSCSRRVTVSDWPTTCEAVRMRPPSAATKPVPIAPPASICTTEGRSLAIVSASCSSLGGTTAAPLSGAAAPPALTGGASSATSWLPAVSAPVPTRRMAPTRTAAPMMYRRRGLLEARGAGIAEAPAPATAAASGGAVGQTSGGVGGRSRQLLCWRSSPAKGSSTGAGLRIGTVRMQVGPNPVRPVIRRLGNSR